MVEILLSRIVSRNDTYYRYIVSFPFSVFLHFCSSKYFPTPINFSSFSFRVTYEAYSCFRIFFLQVIAVRQQFIIYLQFVNDSIPSSLSLSLSNIYICISYTVYRFTTDRQTDRSGTSESYG